MNNGHISPFFPIQRGVRQGCPLSPTLFILCIELLSYEVSSNVNIKGISVDDIEIKNTLFADDATFLTDGSRNSFETLIDVLDNFSNVSGLKLNIDKCNVLKAGSLKTSNIKFCDTKPFQWKSDYAKALGMFFYTDTNYNIMKNIEPKLQEFKNCLKQWQHRKLTLIGKITVIKTFALPKLIYPLTVLPNINEIIIKDIIDSMFKFIWDNKPDKIKRKQITKDYKNGGLKMIDLKTSSPPIKQHETEQNIIPNVNFTKYDRNNISQAFMSSNEIYRILNSKIMILEANQNDQTCIDNSYEEFVNIIKTQMNEYMKPKNVTIGERSNKKRKPSKPWWTDDLSDLWNTLCTHEKQWLKCKDATRKRLLKTVFIESRKRFDRSVQKCKRQYWHKIQSDLLESCNKTPTEFWKTIGKIGVGNARNNKIPMEIVQQDGSVSNSFNQILDKWKSTFEKLYTSEKEEQSYNMTEPPSASDDQSALSNGIDILEVEKAVKSLNKNKATGHDELPAEVIQSPACINYLHRLFSVCFENGTIPKMWTYGIIHPVLKDPTNR